MAKEEDLREIGLDFPLSKNRDRGFCLIGQDKEVLFTGVIGNIGIDTVNQQGACVCIAPRHGGWEISTNTGWIENAEFRWTLRRAGHSREVYVRLELDPVS